MNLWIIISQQIRPNVIDRLVDNVCGSNKMYCAVHHGAIMNLAQVQSTFDSGFEFF